MKNGYCTKYFPKTFCAESTIPEDGYPLYRRRSPDDGGRSFINKSNQIVTNQWVVPYNPYLTKKYGAHLNVEICNEIQAVKYLFKYVHKGPDRITINISRNNSNPNSNQQSATPQTNENYQLPRNEVDNYINSRYVGPCEAFWRIFGFQMHEHEQSVTRLGFHLPNQQNILY
jgi:hypothetical protein